MRRPIIGHHRVRTSRGPRPLVPVLAAALVLSGCVGGPTHVEAVTVANPTAYRARVELRGEDSPGWFGLGAVEPASQRRVGQVLDVGERWTFRFTHPEHSEQLTLQRGELESADWHVHVPESFEQRLRELGVEEPTWP
ncbi:MAG TPA: hypothetical protein VM307_02550 [Egibacteraceae bacterium]|nr:hypothetical protein [Egibacteraceae bacterium]